MSIEDDLDVVRKLKDDLSARVITQEEEWAWEGKGIPPRSMGYDEKGHILYLDKEPERVLVKKEESKPDYEKIRIAKKELKSIYNNSRFETVRQEAGKALGYSKLRRFFHEQPALGIMVGIIAAREIIGCAAYLSCLLGEYFKK